MKKIVWVLVLISLIIFGCSNNPPVKEKTESQIFSEITTLDSAIAFKNSYPGSTRMNEVASKVLPNAGKDDLKKLIELFPESLNMKELTAKYILLMDNFEEIYDILKAHPEYLTEQNETQMISTMSDGSDFAEYMEIFPNSKNKEIAFNKVFDNSKEEGKIKLLSLYKNENFAQNKFKSYINLVYSYSDFRKIIPDFKIEGLDYEAIASKTVKSTYDLKWFLLKYPDSRFEDKIIEDLVHSIKKNNIPKVEIYYLNNRKAKDIRMAYLDQCKSVSECVEAAVLFPEINKEAENKAVEFVKSKDDVKTFVSGFVETEYREGLFKKVINGQSKDVKKDMIRLFDNYKFVDETRTEVMTSMELLAYNLGKMANANREVIKAYAKAKNLDEEYKKEEEKQDKEDSEELDKSVSPAAIRKFLSDYPESKYFSKAKEKEEEYFYKNSDSLNGMVEYIQNYPNGKYSEKIKQKKEDYYYKKAIENNNSISYRKYLAVYPSGKYSVEIKEKMEKYFYDLAMNEKDESIYLLTFRKGKYDREILKADIENYWYSRTNDNSGCEIYLEKYINGKYYKEVNDKREKNLYAMANNIYVIDIYIRDYPNGVHISDIKLRLEDLLNKESNDNLSIINRYIKEFPNGKYSTEMRTKLDSFRKKIIEMGKKNFVYVEGNPYFGIKSFWMGKYEVTQAEWKEAMGNNPSQLVGSNLPVENISWYDAIEYCDKRSNKEDLDFVYVYAKLVTQNILSVVSVREDVDGYRLPTKAEWEYAARGGNKSIGYYYSGGSNLDEIAWHRDNSENKIHDVGTKKPNELGIYDMSGNVREFCQDLLNGTSAYSYGASYFEPKEEFGISNAACLELGEKFAGQGLRIIKTK